MNTQTNIDLRQAMFDQYRHEVDGSYGFGAPSQWGKGRRDFIGYLNTKGLDSNLNPLLTEAEHRLATDTETALNIIATIIAKKSL